MIIVFHHDAQSGQVQSHVLPVAWEGPVPVDAVIKVAEAGLQLLKQQVAQQTNGQPPEQRRGNIILPPTFIPKDMKGGVDE
jgi:hypothetical protein